jgi:peptidoglycan/xylan/chitin deacetylase (PgdA/CDA1 family)
MGSVDTDARRKQLVARRELRRRQVRRRRIAALTLPVSALLFVWVAMSHPWHSTEQTKADGRESGRLSPQVSTEADEAGIPKGVAKGVRRRRVPVPILMYHVIASPPATAPYPGLFVPRKVFAAQMRYLSRHGYHAVTLQQVFDHWRRGDFLPRHPVVISFDDGFSNWYTKAYPILRSLSWAGTMNLALSHLASGDVSPWWVKKLIQAGWELDSHTLSHADLTQLDPAQLTEEVRDSRQKLRRLFHVPVNFFCYPSGRFNSTVIEAVRSAGYLGATTTMFGLAAPSDAFALDRIRVLGTDGASGLGAKLAAAGA